jgi:hypothetical protein
VTANVTSSREPAFASAVARYGVISVSSSSAKTGLAVLDKPPFIFKKGHQSFHMPRLHFKDKI